MAAIPVGIWLYILFKDKKHEKLWLTFMFSGGILAVLIVFALQFFWSYFPELDPFLWIEKNIPDPIYYYAWLFVFVGILEEIVKQFMVRYVDTKRVLIQTINDSIRFSIVAALGFAFAENILYFYMVMVAAPIQEVIVTFLFRSIFTAAAHMMFSGIFGYYFGIAKFTLEITEQKAWRKKVNLFVRVLSKGFRMPLAQAFREYKILQGLTIAIVLHAIFNYLLQMNYILPVIALVVIGFLYMQYLLSRKAGSLILVTDISERRKAKIARSDQEVVLELLGMWFEKKKYVDVLHICERLLERDPDNNVVKLFKAKAMDKLDPDNPYRKALDAIFGKSRSERERNTITYYRKKNEANKKNLSSEKKEKLFRFIEEKKKMEDETYRIDL